MSASNGHVTRAIALVHHANQPLMGEGYDNRDGIGVIAAGYANLLDLHERYAVPANLHLSGTLIEALAWGHPELLERVRRLAEAGLVSILGGTYGENVMPLFSEDFNRRQLEEALGQIEDLLNWPAEHVTVAWVPERVWDTDRLARLFTSSDLPNGGYRAVLLDDRVLFGVGRRYPDGPRAAFDRSGPFETVDGEAVAHPQLDPDAVLYPWRIADGHGLALFPISADLRYAIPPRRPGDFEAIERCLAPVASGRDGAIAVYADDMEKTAGVAGWAPRVGRYEAFLKWVVTRPGIEAVLLDRRLETHPPVDERVIEPGTFFELAHDWGAREDYRGWAGGAAWAPHRRRFQGALKRVEEARDGDPRLLDLAWKHLLASAHETAWHDPDPGGDGRAPAPWASAMASHARSATVIARAAEALNHGGAGTLAAEVCDVDGDGWLEVVLRDATTYAVLTPQFGGRLVYLFSRTPQGGVLLVGNPTDHWNFQEAQNRFMDQPANHPGALADVGAEHDVYAIDAYGADAGRAFVSLVNVTPASPLRGTRKSIVLAEGTPGLAVSYDLPARVDGLATVVCCSPDYLTLLRQGRRQLIARGGVGWRGFSNGAGTAWAAVDGQSASWHHPPQAETVHGVSLCVHGHAPGFRFAVGHGEPVAAVIENLLGTAPAVSEDLRRRRVVASA